ncbi:RDD family protein [Actinoplanes sp. DH11]|uniref:RDD family protein n=1 Tax=Actinoplanes sp. DH11 TaxID=2857011 RepID=UPI001E56097B|nr:RDD family protein [Actinoplanes sp. DH11]
MTRPGSAVLRETGAAPGGYGGLVSRAMAYAADAFLVVLLSGATGMVLVMIASVAGVDAREIRDLVVSPYLLGLPSVMAIYCASFWLLAGRTPGMAVLGLRVVRADGRPVRWPAALVRGVLLAYFPVGALWLIVDRRRQAVHDKVAGTVVVRVPG